MILQAKERSKTWTMASEELPKEITDALLQGYDVRIVREVKEGLVMAKIIFLKYTGASRKVIGREEELKKRK